MAGQSSWHRSYVLHRDEMEGIDATLLWAQLRSSGHVLRMSDRRLPKRLFYRELKTGKRSRGRSKKRYKDSLKESLKRCNIPDST